MSAARIAGGARGAGRVLRCRAPGTGACGDFPRSLHLFGAVGLGGVALGCMPAIDRPTAYAGEQYLCGADAAPVFGERLAACRQVGVGQCAGVFSAAGTLQGEEVSIDAELGRAIFSIEAQGASELLSRVDLSGSSPYFLFELKLKSLGGDLAASGPQNVALAWDPSASSAGSEASDGMVEGAFRVSNGRESVELFAQAGSGALRLGWLAAGELAASFDAAFGDTGSQLRGCFRALASETRTTTRSAQEGSGDESPH